MSRSRYGMMLALAAASVLGPVSAKAADLKQHNDITITRDGEFSRSNGIVSGHGTMMDPYVITGWNVFNISISDTTKAVRIAGNTISGTLRLNWIGADVLVERNAISDLRVNENVPRWGMPTAGIIRNNTFDVVGQLRHFDGKFIYNTVGHPQRAIDMFQGPAVTFDGFNGATFAYNTIYGYMDARLHGHHHSSGYGKPSHQHSGTGSMDESVDHSQRYHEVTIAHNHIIAGNNNSYALAYLDTNHAGNDRTAQSETNPNLNAPHVHHTRVHILDNVLEGAGIYIDVFNAADELHTAIAQGLMDIERNTITLQRAWDYPFDHVQGISVFQAHGLTLTIAKNTVMAPAPLADQAFIRGFETNGSGVGLNDLDAATVSITDTRVTNLEFGVEASQMTKSVRWTVRNLKTDGVEQAVTYDSSVANPPKK